MDTLDLSKVTVALPVDMQAFIRESLSTEGASDPAEFIVRKLREAKQREIVDHIDDLLAEGFASGPLKEMMPSDWDAMRERVHAKAASRNGQ